MEFFDTHPDDSGRGWGGIQVGRTKGKRKDGTLSTSKGPSQPHGSTSSYQPASRGQSTSQASKGKEQGMSARSVVRARMGLDGDQQEEGSARSKKKDGPIKPRSGREPLSSIPSSSSKRPDIKNNNKGKLRDGETTETDDFPLPPLTKTGSIPELEPIASSQDSIGYSSKAKRKVGGKGKGLIGKQKAKAVKGGCDSPDPLALGYGDRDPSRSPSALSRDTAPRKLDIKKIEKKKRGDVLVSSSPAEYAARPVKLSKKPILGRKGRRGTFTTTSSSSSESDIDATPRPRSTKVQYGKAKIKVNKEQKKEEEGEAFFREFLSLNKEEREERMRLPQASSSQIGREIGSPSPISAVDLDIEDQELPERLRLDNIGREDDVDDDLTAEERLYCSALVDRNNLCEFCGSPMPIDLSDRLRKIQAELSAVKDDLRLQGEKLSWTRTVEFCAIHQAETTVIPLGLRAGYPRDIDFTSLPNRLEDAWIRKEMEEEVMQTPEISSFYVKTVSSIQKKGKWKWLSMKNQSKKEVIDPTMPGYYGQLGRAIIMRHYENLLDWDLLPLIDTSIAPLTATEFISHVLVPEAAIRLIMADNGWTGHQPSDTDEYTNARKSAFKIKADSIPFGRGLHSADGEEARKAIDDLEEADIKFREECRERRQEKRKEDVTVDEDKVLIVDISSDEGGDIRTPKKKRKVAGQRSTHVNDGDDRDDRNGSNDDNDTPRMMSKGRRGQSPIQIHSSPISVRSRRRQGTKGTGSNKKVASQTKKEHGFSRTPSAQSTSTYGFGEEDGDFEDGLMALGEEIDERG